MNLSNSTKPSIPKQYQEIKEYNSEHLSLIDQGGVIQKVKMACRGLSKAPGVHSRNRMETGGFKYTENADAARCSLCKLEVANWTNDMQPFTIHSQRSPMCPYVVSLSSCPTGLALGTNILSAPTSALNDQEPPCKKLRPMTPCNNVPPSFLEANTLKQVRKRTFNHWSSEASASAFQMIEAGFFACNVTDRVICIYCNIICQQWIPHSDDPCEVHKALRPNCPYVKYILNRTQTSCFPVINEQNTSYTNGRFRSTAIVLTAAYHTAYIEIPKRFASFANWSHENVPPVDDLVRAGFFYSGDKSIVTCFYCNGSLQNWGTNDNPTIEHARWFPQCAYAKQLCGTELYRKIQESKRVQQDRSKGNTADNRLVTSSSGSVGGGGGLLIPDESTLSRLVAARLDLPISARLFDRGFRLSIVKRCWEDQLRLKHDDFESDSDLLLACVILKKQIDHIDGKKENIIVPSVALREMREKETAEACGKEEVIIASTTSSAGNNAILKAATVPQEFQRKKKVFGKANINALPTNPCVLCLKEERRLACIPCGHLITCVPCGQSLRSCPICRREIDAFVRIWT